MIPENFKKLIDKLKEKTTAKQAIWTKTSRDNEYKLDIGKGAITLDYWQDMEDATWLVDIAIMNDRGDRVDSFVTSEGEDFKTLKELHLIARRSYYKVDETFQNIFKELDKEGKIGSENNGDDLRF